MKGSGALVFAAVLMMPPSWCHSANARPPRAYFSGKNELPLVQHLVVRQLAARKIAFTMSSRLASGPDCAISGTAVGEPGQADQDPEVDDDDGGAYFVDVYFFTRGTCSLEIRIEEGRKRKATVFESGCGAFHPGEAPFETRSALTTRK